MKKRFKLISLCFGSQLPAVLKANWRLVSYVCLIMIAETALTLAQPWPIRSMIDHVISYPALGSHGTQDSLFVFIMKSVKGIFSDQDIDFLFTGIGLLIIIYVSNSVLSYLENISLARLGQKSVLRIRETLFSHLITLPHSFFEKSRTGDLTSRISKDTADIQDILESLITVFIRSLPTVFGILIVSFMLDKIYSLTFVLVIPLVFWANAIFTRRTKTEIRLQRRIEGGMASTVQEALYYHKAVATLSLEGGVVESFLTNGRQSAYHGVRAGRSQGMLIGAIDLLVGVSTVLVLFVGMMRIIHGCLTVGQLMVFLTYLNSLFKPVREITKFTGRIAKSAAALERVEEIIRLNPMEIGASDLPDASEAPRFRGSIDLKNITFGYGDAPPILKDFSISIPAGRKVAIVGGSGSGKSTLLQLIMRLYDPQQGEICIDGTEIRGFKINSLRHQMATVLQDSFIFNMSIADNIALARPEATQREVRKAAKLAEADEFIKELPSGYDTILGEGGSGLSGGQKRRLAIARAFLRDAPIILLDEPTTGLDSASEKKVVDAIARLTRGRTTLLVTHQLSVVTDADLIVVVSRGEIVQTGTHEELLAKEGHYRELWNIQRRHQ